MDKAASDTTGVEKATIRPCDGAHTPQVALPAIPFIVRLSDGTETKWFPASRAFTEWFAPRCVGGNYRHHYFEGLALVVVEEADVGLELEAVFPCCCHRS